MAQNFTTDVTQWQGVDKNPTAGSHNFTESGGIFKEDKKIEFPILGQSRTVATEIGVNYRNIIYSFIPAGTRVYIEVSGESGLLSNDLFGDLGYIEESLAFHSYKSNFSSVNGVYNATFNRDIYGIYVARGAAGVAAVGNITLKIWTDKFIESDDFTRYANLKERITSFDNVLFAGDSVTKGYTSNNVILENCWVNLFCRKIGCNYTNVAVGGAKLQGGGILSQLQGVNLNNYSVIFITGGINDKHQGYTKAVIKSAVIDICNYLQANYTGKVIWQTPQNDYDQRTSYNANGRNLQNSMSCEELRQIIFNTVVPYGFSVVDGRFIPFPSRTDNYIAGVLSEDNVHPTELGHRLYAQYMIDTIGYIDNKDYVSVNITDWDSGYYNVDKEFVSLSTWRAKEIQIDNTISAISIDVDCTGANAYCYLLDDEDNALLTWNNESINDVIYLRNYPTAVRLLLSSRAGYAYSASNFAEKSYILIKNEAQARQAADSILQANINAISLQVDEYNKNFWKLHSSISLLKNGTLKGTNVPSGNIAIAWFKNIRNIWYIKAHLEKGDASRVNAGFVVSPNMQGNILLLMKCIFQNADYTGSNASAIDTYNKNNGSFENIKRIYEDANDKRNAVDAALVMSGNAMHVYLDGELKGHSYKDMFSPYGSLFAGILFGSNNTVSNVEFGERLSSYAHFSLDDIGNVMKTIAEDNTLTSIFDNEMFAFLKDMHDKYGMCITLNLFDNIIVDENTWSLSSFPATFRNEFIENSAWLKFAFHGGDESIKYNSEDNNAACIASYADVITQIIRFAGGCCIDYMPRMTFFSGNKTLFNSLRDTGNFWGCLTADDTRAANSGLNEVERACIADSSDYIDFTNNLYYVRTQHRFDSYTTEQAIAHVKGNLDNMRKNVVLEYFTHAATTISAKDRVSIEEALKLLVAHNIRMDFAMNNMPF